MNEPRTMTFRVCGVARQRNVTRVRFASPSIGSTSGVPDCATRCQNDSVLGEVIEPLSISDLSPELRAPIAKVRQSAPEAALLRDLRLAIRSLRATPVVTLVAVLSLALGIGANTAIFSLVDRLVLRSLPVREPAKLALVVTTAQLSYTPNYSYAVFADTCGQRRDSRGQSGHRVE